MLLFEVWLMIQTQITHPVLLYRFQLKIVLNQKYGNKESISVKKSKPKIEQSQEAFQSTKKGTQDRNLTGKS